MSKITKNDMKKIARKYIKNEDNSDLWCEEVEILYNNKMFYCPTCKKYICDMYDVSPSEDGLSVWCEDCGDKIL